MTAPPLPRRLQGRVDEGPATPEVLHVGDEAWININDLRRLLNYRCRRASDNGYINALIWVRATLKELSQPE